MQWCEADHAHMWSDRHRPTDIGHTHDNYHLRKWFAQDRPNCSVIGHIFVLHTHTNAHSYLHILLEYSAEFSCVLQVPYSRVVTPPLLKRNFALKRGGGRNNENCIHLCVVTPPLPKQQYRCHSPVPHVRSLPQGNKRTHLAKITT